MSTSVSILTGSPKFCILKQMFMDGDCGGREGLVEVEESMGG